LLNLLCFFFSRFYLWQDSFEERRYREEMRQAKREERGAAIPKVGHGDVGEQQ
jgi:hypothetical protein